MGCQDLLEEVPGRSRKDQGVFSSPTDAKSWYKLKPSSSKSYSIKDETSSKFKFLYLHIIFTSLYFLSVDYVNVIVHITCAQYTEED